MNRENQSLKPNLVDIKGECIGVSFLPRGENDKHILIEIAIEDDERWYPKTSLSSYWIDDFIEVLQKAKVELEKNHNKDRDGYGYEFK